MVTGTSVLGLIYKDGVMLCADTLLSYGSMAKSHDTPRIVGIHNTLVGASGDYSDFQKLQEILTAHAVETSVTTLMTDEAGEVTAEETWHYLRRILYTARSKFNPYWNEMVVAGFDDGKPFLGQVDKIGTAVTGEPYAATGYGAYLALPLLREHWKADMEEGEARALLEDCAKVLWYRDCRASPKIVLGKCDAAGLVVSDPYSLLADTNWDAPQMRETRAGLASEGGW